MVPADASLAQAQRLMNPRGLRQLPVVAANGEGQLGIDSGSYVVGLLDREAISVACRSIFFFCGLDSLGFFEV